MTALILFSMSKKFSQISHLIMTIRSQNHVKIPKTNPLSLTFIQKVELQSGLFVISAAQKRRLRVIAVQFDGHVDQGVISKAVEWDTLSIFQSRMF